MHPDHPVYRELMVRTESEVCQATQDHRALQDSQDPLDPKVMQVNPDHVV